LNSTWRTLRPAAGLKLELIRKGTLWTVPHDVAGVLWELAPEDGAQRLVAALIGNRPAASYSVTMQPGLVDLSRALGFREHLSLPLTLEDVERALGFARVHRPGRSHRRPPRLASCSWPTRPEAIGAVVRSLNVSLDPANVAAALALRAAEWLPLTEWSVLACEPDGAPHWLGREEGDPSIRAAAQSFAEIVVQYRPCPPSA
jgi:hypothetical protein